MSHSEIELSTSPCSTWLCASDVAQAVEATALLEAAGCHPMAVPGRNAEQRVVDVEAGLDSPEAFLALREAGYSFRRPAQQAAVNRGLALFGIPVEG